MLDCFTQPAITIFLAILTPTLSFTALNIRFFTARQAWIAVLLAFVFACMGGGAMSLISARLMSLTATANLATYGVSLPNALGSLLALCLFFMLHERFFTELLPAARQRHLVMWGSGLFFAGSATFYSLAILNTVLVLFLFSSCLDWWRMRKDPKEPLFAASRFRQYYNPRIKRNVILKHKPNIYLLLLESYHSAEALQTLYGIDDSATDELLARYNFTDYKRVFSNEPATVASLHTLLDCTLLGYLSHARQSSFVLDVLRENGYNCEFFDSSFFVFGHLMCQNDFAAFDMPAHVRLLYALAGPVWGQSRYLRKLVKNYDPFKTEINFNFIFSTFAKRLGISSESPRCFCMRFGACHIDNTHKGWLRDGSDFAKKYTKVVYKAQQNIRMVIENIMLHDPDALIVAVGDHGSLRHSGAWKGAGTVNQVLRERGISTEELALDHFGVRLAVRWPVEHKTKGQILSHVNLFRYILDALGAEGLLDNFQPNISRLDECWMLVRDAQPLEELQRFHPAEFLHSLRLRFEEGKATTEDCITLAYALEYTDALFARRVLEWAEKQYPDAGGLDFILGRILCLLNDPKSLVYLQCAVSAHPEDASIKLQYLNALLVFDKPRELLQLAEKMRPSEISPEGAFNIMQAYSTLGCNEQAIEYASNFISTHKAISTSYYYAGLLQFGLKAYSAASELAVQGIAVVRNKHSDMRLFNVYRLNAASLIRLQQWDKAEDQCRLLCVLKSEDVWNWLLWSYACDELGDAAKAMQVLVQAADKCSPNTAILQRMGHLARKHNLKAPSLHSFRKLADEELVTTNELFARSNLVDIQQYQSQAPHDPAARFPYRHYVLNGVYQGVELVPWFDSFFYLLGHSDVWKAGINPFVHFLLYGCTEARIVALCRHITPILAKHPELREDTHELLQKLHQQWSQQHSV